MRYTAPDPLTYHPLTEDQIEILCHGADDQSLNIAFFTLGLAGGFIQNVVGVVTAWKNGKSPDGTDLWLGFVCLVLLGIGLSKLTEWLRNKPHHKALKKRILERTTKKL